MLIDYSELNQTKDVKDPIVALAHNNHWFLWGLKDKSSYFGYWIKRDTQIFKLIDSIELTDEIEKIEVIEPYFVKLFCKDNVIELMLSSQGFALKASRAIKLKLNFDFRRIFSSQRFGNNYQVLPLDKGYGVNFTQEQEHYNLHAYLFFDGELKFINRWKETLNNFDRQRHAPSATAWVLEAFEGYCAELNFFCPDKRINSFSLACLPAVGSSNLSLFLLKRVVALYDDYFEAGLPWFSQNWFRDELICLWLLNGFLGSKESAIALRQNKSLQVIQEEIINRYLNNLESFVFSNRLGGEAAVDTLLWVVYLLSDKQIEEHKKKIEMLLGEWLKLYFRNGRLSASPKATWMDTLDRPVSIENEVLFLKVIEKLKDLKIEKLQELGEVYKRKLKTYLTTELYPKEELSKPNMFLAYLIDPQFLSSRKWEKLFDNLIRNNFLPWGGFSTLPRSDNNFHWFSTGRDSASYHQGDSWFWLNNLAAIAMQDLNRAKYKTYIEKIKSASLKNLLELGALGWSSELSSAAQLRSEGSPIQLWSLASLLRLISE